MTKNNNSHCHSLSACPKRTAFNAHNIKAASTGVCFTREGTSRAELKQLAQVVTAIIRRSEI